MISRYCIFVVLAVGLVLGHPAEDQIIDLPGLDVELNYLQYSGYLNGTEGKFLHYWFTESARPDETPLILWLNGGPGCSSLDGLLTENGPFLTKSDGSGLEENPYGWNSVGNVIYLESPACVGFSYDINNTCNTSDNMTTDSNYLALQHFFIKFPEYRDRDFYITGESYAGIYIPKLAVKIVEENENYPINLKGFVIGNGITSYLNNDNSLMFYGYYHSLLGQKLWSNMIESCCDGVETQECDFYRLDITPACEAFILEAEDILYYRGINVYNIYTECESPPTEGDGEASPSRHAFDRMNMFYNSRSQRPEPYLDPTCTDSSTESNYLNSDAVRAALHIPDEVPDWEICSNEVNRHYKRQVFNTASLLRTLHDNNIRGVLYNGDVDIAVNFLGNQWDIQKLEYPVLEDRKQWTYGGQVAGYVIKYELLDFVTVRGSGHMVPTDKPAEALRILSAFINNEPY